MAESDDVTLYKYISTQYAVDALKNRRLYLSDGSNLNDPFELTVVNRESGVIERINGLHILCLTNSSRAKLMWSYYGENHKGICVSVKVPKRLVHPICYTSERVYVDSDVDAIIARSAEKRKSNIKKPPSEMRKDKKIAFIKDRKWKDEKEYRIVLDDIDKKNEKRLEQDNGDWFLRVKIDKVYLGVFFEKNTEEIKCEIRNACKNEIDIIEMRMSTVRYSIEETK